MLGTCYFHNFVFYSFGVRDLYELKFIFGSRSLDLDISEVKRRLDKSIDVNRDILNAGRVQFGNIPAEKAVLRAVDNAPVRHDPDIECVHREMVKENHPQKHDPNAEDKETD